MSLVTLAIFALLSVGFTKADVCNPIINVNSGSGESGTGDVTVTTEIQVEQTRELFKTVSEQLLDEYEKRFEAFVSTLDVSSRPKDCQDVYDQGSTQTGVYRIFPDGTRGFPVRCDMDTAGGGWTVIQRRISDSDFYKGWFDYQIGFGNLTENYWFGNQQINMLTSQGWYELRIDMTHPDNRTAYAAYNTFSIGNAESRYKLFVEGYHGDAGDSLAYHNGYRFSTSDKDYDSTSSNCAAAYHGAWWYRACHHSNLNGDYGSTAYAKGLIWYTFTTHTKSLTKSEMKIRRWMPTASQSSVSSGND